MKYHTLAKIILLGFISIVLSGCLESSFQLSNESRLPNWFNIPEGKKRSDFTVQLDLHSTIGGGKNVFKIYEKDSVFPIKEYSITSKEQPRIFCEELKSSPSSSPKGYPCYMVITINGISDVVELKKMEPIFYMTDDPKVWNELGIE